MSASVHVDYNLMTIHYYAKRVSLNLRLIHTNQWSNNPSVSSYQYQRNDCNSRRRSMCCKAMFLHSQTKREFNHFEYSVLQAPLRGLGIFWSRIPLCNVRWAMALNSIYHLEPPKWTRCMFHTRIVCFLVFKMTTYSQTNTLPPSIHKQADHKHDYDCFANFSVDSIDRHDDHTLFL